MGSTKDGRRTITIAPDAATTAKLDRLAAEAGLTAARLASYLLDELAPTIKSVKTRVQVTREPTQR